MNLSMKQETWLTKASSGDLNSGIGFLFLLESISSPELIVVLTWPDAGARMGRWIQAKLQRPFLRCVCWAQGPWERQSTAYQVSLCLRDTSPSFTASPGSQHWPKGCMPKGAQTLIRSQHRSSGLGKLELSAAGWTWMISCLEKSAGGGEDWKQRNKGLVHSSCFGKHPHNLLWAFSPCHP